MIEQLSDKILSMLQTLVGAGQPFHAVYDYHTQVSDGYPYISFEATDFKGDTLDNSSNIRDYIFLFMIVQDFNPEAPTGRRDALRKIYRAMDKVILMFDLNFTLDGLAPAGVEPSVGTIDPVLIANGKAIVGSMIINCGTVNQFRN